MRKQQTEPPCPGSPRTAATSAGSSGPHSDLTDNRSINLEEEVDDENFIALLQYRDAYHILNLSPSQSTDPISPEIVQNAYDVAKEQALMALEQFEVTHQQKNNHGGRNMFFISQKNYLELKLQALDQAYEELMPDELMGDEDEGEQDAGHDDASVASASPKKSLEVEQAPPSPQTPSTPSRRDNAASVNKGSPGGSGNDASTNVAVRNGAQNKSKGSPPSRRYRMENEGEPSDDELDTIDIYFQPTPTKNQSSPASNERQKQPPSKTHMDHPSDMSSCTWDGSSIFSIISQTKKILDDVSDSGLSDVLGPKAIGDNLHNVPPPMTIEGRASPKARNFGKESSRQSSRSMTSQRPPSGINVKHKMGGPRAQISPKSVTDFPGSIHNDNHYDSSSGFNSRGVGRHSIVGKGKMMKGSRAASIARHNQHLSLDATEAARMGILRALTEDNSECFPLEDEPTYALNVSHDISNNTPGLSTNAMIEGRNTRGAIIGGRSPEGLPKSRRYFQGKTDRMPRESNSLLASVQNDDGTRLTYDDSTMRGTSSLTEGQREQRGDAATATSSRSSPTPSRRKEQRGGSKSKNNTYSDQSSSSPRNGSNNNSNESKKKDGKENRPDDLLQSSEDSYDVFLQTGMELADELCMALNNCFKGVGIDGDPTEFSKTFSRASSAASAAFDAAASEMDRSSSQLDSASPCGRPQTFFGRSAQLEEESTVFTRSTYNEEDESTAYNTRSVYTTDGESTAFNTMSSFSHRRGGSISSNNSVRNRKVMMGMRPTSPNTVSTGSSDPPPRMLV